MMSEPEDEGAEVPITPSILTAVLFEEGADEPLEEFTLCHLRFSIASEECFCHVIPITVQNGRLLVAVPSSAWHRTVARRYLPANGLSKFVSVAVAVDKRGDEPPALDTVKVWVGYLNDELIACGEVGGSDEPGVASFGDDLNVEVRPSVEALFAVANEQFGFFTAPSAGGEEDLSPIHGRIAQLEAGVEDIRKTLAALPAQLASFGGVAPLPPKDIRPGEARGLSARGATPKKAAVQPDLKGLDPGVVTAARQAGVPEDQLRKLSALLVKPNQMQDFVQPSGRKRNVLSESEAEEDEDVEADGEVGGAETGNTAPIEKAVLQLSKLVRVMAEKRGPGSKSGFDGIFERIETAGEPSSSSSGGGRSKALAYKKLKAALIEKPDWISSAVEELMNENFSALRQAPGLGAVPCTARGWLEHRSKLLHYPATIRFGWTIAGILDSLRNDKVSEAKARAYLALIAIDQSSIDSGSWALAQEVLLEAPAPFSSFAGRKAVDVNEQVASRLLDDRMLDLFLWRLKDKDAYLESRRRLNAGRPKPPPADQPGRDQAPKGNPKGAPKGKAKTKPRHEGPNEEPHVDQ